MQRKEGRKQDLKEIKKTFDEFCSKISAGQDYLEEDLLFHLAIAKASKNNTLLTLMLLITPPILSNYDRDTVCEGDEVASEIKKHENIYIAIKSKDADRAKKMMQVHFQKLTDFIEKIKSNT